MCEYCMGRVRNAEGDCQNCAAKRDEANSKVTEPVKLSDDWEPQGNIASPGPLNKPLIAGAIVGGVILVSLLVWALWPKHVYATVKATEWSVTTVVYQRQLNHGSGWGTPAGSFNPVCEVRFKENVPCNPHNCRPHSESYSCHSEHYQCHPHSQSYSCNCTSRDCNCHESCRSLKNGYSKCTTKCSTCRSCSTCSRTVYDTCERHDTCTRTVYDTCYDICPVNDQWCTYDYFTWFEIKRMTNSGFSMITTPPVFEQTDPNQTYKTEQIEKYTVIFVDKNNQEYKYEPRDYNDYSRFFTTQTWDLRIIAGTVHPEVIP